MSTSVTVPTSTAQNTQPLPRPTYLQGVTLENAIDRPTKSALHIFENGTLSPMPCRLCVETSTVCIVAPAISGRCLRCSYKSKSNRHCLAGGVKASIYKSKPSASSLIDPSAATPDFQAVMARSEPQAARESAFPVETFSIPLRAAKPQSNTNRHAPSKQKRKRSLSDPFDALENAAKHLRGTTSATLTEHPYAPTAPKASTPAPVPANEAATANELSNVRFAPFGSIEYDLAIRTEDRVAWAQWANDLYKEVRALRYIQDLGPYTMGVIAMMKEDGVWPTGNPIDLEEE